jgi:hypothetical protein
MKSESTLSRIFRVLFLSAAKSQVSCQKGVKVSENALTLENFSSSNFDRWKVLYERVGRMDEVFVEWRNKLLTFGMAGAGLAVGGAEYLHQHDRTVTWIAALFGYAICRAVVLFDQRNASLLVQIRDAGKRLECRHPHGYYSRIEQYPASRISYGNVLSWMFSMFGIAFLILGIVGSLV